MIAIYVDQRLLRTEVIKTVDTEKEKNNKLVLLKMRIQQRTYAHFCWKFLEHLANNSVFLQALPDAYFYGKTNNQFVHLENEMNHLFLTLAHFDFVQEIQSVPDKYLLKMPEQSLLKQEGNSKEEKGTHQFALTEI